VPTELAVVFALALTIPGCVPDADTSRAADAVRVPTALPDGRMTLISFSRAPAGAVASPEALRHHLETTYWPAEHAEISSRRSLPDGFAVTFARSNTRETHVVRQIGNEWFRCTASPVADDTMRDAVIALCRAHARL
jgi:hypothetical protein